MVLVAMFVPFSAEAQALPKGIAILAASPARPARNIVFKDILWVNPGGIVTSGLNGTPAQFDQTEVTQILYLDKGYYDQITADAQFKAYRGDIRKRETVIESVFPNVGESNQLALVETSIGELGAFEGNYPSTTDALAPVIVSLESIVSKYKSGEREAQGQWMSYEDYQSRFADKPGSVSFTLKDGTRFENVQVQIGETGLNVITPVGGTTIPFSQLREDGGGLPADLTERLRPLIPTPTPDPNPPPPPVEFPYWNYVIGGSVILVSILGVVLVMSSGGSDRAADTRSSKNLRFTYAGLGTRFLANLIDNVLLVAARYVTGLNQSSTHHVQDFILVLSGGSHPELLGKLWPILYDISFDFLLLFLYFGILDGTGGTLGKRAVGIQVITPDGRPISLLRSIWRCFGRILGFLFCYGGFLSAFLSVERKAWHDHLAGTLVVRK